MKISLSSLARSLEYARTNEWSISFGEATPNIWKSGGSVGDSFPAVTVEEPLYKTETDNLTLPDGFVIPFPKTAFFGGSLTVEFYDDSKLALHTYFTKWASELHTLSLNIEDIERKCKVLNVFRYSQTEPAPIYTNSYMVLPPEGLKNGGDNEVALLTNRAEFTIVKVLKKQNLQ